jgi:hypothetical protein
MFQNHAVYTIKKRTSYKHVLWYTKVLPCDHLRQLGLMHMERIYVSDTRTSGSRMMDCYCHFQIHAVHIADFSQQ